ncbi:hypothetical protein J5N97_012700 [Dioscorea zingiberensis]|uniref:cellulase n=1 Tax=Dioscorea zingiberensis TaxID=325984 RepID=A0A9D5CPF7_9LILI|nr:hypothetical protein J5N97_012700 [Dioscorea zingiberensis]
MACKLLFLQLLWCSFLLVLVHGNPNYGDALEKSILFFEGQRSGELPPDQRITWRSHSGLTDGSQANVTLTGGYYDGGDNVKFSFPMAFTVTMLAWSIIEHGESMDCQLDNARAALRWGSDYLLKTATAAPGKLFVGVGDPNAEQECWERPEDMDTPRTVYSVSNEYPGSDVAGETAAALAAASIVFQKEDHDYSKQLMKVAKKVMKFAVKYKGNYSDVPGSPMCTFYCSYSGFQDELFWGSSWLFLATKKKFYFKYLDTLGFKNKSTDFFSWDDKLAGAQILLSTRGRSYYRTEAEDFMCRILPNSPSSTTNYTKGGLMFKLEPTNLQYVTSITFLISTYAKYMASSNHNFYCGDILVTAESLRTLAKKQVDYILGENPMNLSYMVGYGERFPQQIYHRSSSIPSMNSHPSHVTCEAGFEYLKSNYSNPNILIGAVVGGPDQNDAYLDVREDKAHTEPTTYINAPLVGSLAYLAGIYGC